MSENYGTSMTTRFGTLVKKNIADDVVALYLRGSAARDDQVIGLSDIDFYMVVRDELLGNIPLRERFYNKLSSLVEYMNQRWADEKLSLRIVPLSYLSTNNVGSFLTGINARLLIGTDVLGKFPQPLSWDISRFGIRELDRFLNYWSNSSYRRKSGNILDEVVYQQEVVLKLAQTALLSKGILKARKSEATNAFLKEFPNFRLAHIVDQAQHLRSIWPRTASNMNLKNFADEARQFPQALRDHLLVKN